MEEKGKKQEITVLSDKDYLDEESAGIVKKIVHENDTEKQKDLTYLFNANQNKKTIVRMNKLNDLYDAITDQALKRWTERPDEMSNQELLTGLKTVQDLVERSQNQINGVNEAPAPLIQINQQNNSIPTETLSRDSREKVQEVVAKILGQIDDGHKGS